MASCSYSSLLRDKAKSCGSNWISPEDFHWVSLKDCNKDISKHLMSWKVSNKSVVSEAQLLLARASTVLTLLCMPFFSIGFGMPRFFIFNIYLFIYLLQLCVTFPSLQGCLLSRTFMKHWRYVHGIERCLGLAGGVERYYVPSQAKLQDTRLPQPKEIVELATRSQPSRWWQDNFSFQSEHVRT